MPGCKSHTPASPQPPCTHQALHGRHGCGSAVGLVGRAQAQLPHQRQAAGLDGGLSAAGGGEAKKRDATSPADRSHIVRH